MSETTSDLIRNFGAGDLPPYEPHNASSTGLTNQILVAGGECLLYGFSVYSNKATAQFIQVFDLSTIPGSGAVPDIVFTVSGTSNLAANWVPYRVMRKGCVLVNSSTAATFTQGSADTWFDVQVY
jgi:hypothetical protein